jgi:hypothetical protein
MNMETDFQLPQYAANFLISYEMINLLERTLFNGMSWLGYSCRKPCTFTYYLSLLLRLLLLFFFLAHPHVLRHSTHESIKDPRDLLKL